MQDQETKKMVCKLKGSRSRGWTQASGMPPTPFSLLERGQRPALDTLPLLSLPLITRGDQDCDWQVGIPLLGLNELPGSSCLW